MMTLQGNMAVRNVVACIMPFVLDRVLRLSGELRRRSTKSAISRNRVLRIYGANNPIWFPQVKGGWSDEV